MTTPDSSVPTETAPPPTPPPPPVRWHHADSPTAAPCIRLMCSFGGRILPRPHGINHELRYVGGDTRIVALHRSAATFSSLLSKLSKFAPAPDVTIKYQLPHEDLDALISLTSDEDVDNMVEEHDCLLARGNAGTSSPPRTPRLRLFLFPSDDGSGGGGGGGFGSMLSTSSSKHDRWFADVLNGRTLERGRSEASSVVSEVPDYLFGLDNNLDEPPARPKTTGVSVPSSRHGSTSSVASMPPMPDLPPVKTKPAGPDVSQQGGGGYVQNPSCQYVESVPTYYVPAPAPGGAVPLRPVPVPMQQYVQRAQPVATSPQIPVGYRPVYIGAPPSYEAPPTSTGGLMMRNSQVPIPMYIRQMAIGEMPANAGSETRVFRPSR